MENIVLITTENQETALIVKDAILNQKLSAGVNIIPNITTFYWFDNKIQESAEYILLFRTTEVNSSKFKDTLLNINPEIEISVMAVNQINDNYMQWILSTVSG